MSGTNFGIVVVACALWLVTLGGEKASAQPSIAFDATGTTDEKANAGFGFQMKRIGNKTLNAMYLVAVSIDGVDVKSKTTEFRDMKTKQNGSLIIADNNNGYVLKAGKHTVKMTVKLDDGTLVTGSADVDFQKVAGMLSLDHPRSLFSSQLLLVGANKESRFRDVTVYPPPFGGGPRRER
jgi:hypothetical protein